VVLKMYFIIVSMSKMHIILSERPAVSMFRYIRVFCHEAIWRHWESMVPKIDKSCNGCIEFIQQSLLQLDTKQMILIKKF